MCRKSMRKKGFSRSNALKPQRIFKINDAVSSAIGCERQTRATISSFFSCIQILPSEHISVCLMRMCVCLFAWCLCARDEQIHVLRQRTPNWIGRFSNLFEPWLCALKATCICGCRKQLHVNSFMSFISIASGGFVVIVATFLYSPIFFYPRCIRRMKQKSSSCLSLSAVVTLFLFLTLPLSQFPQPDKRSKTF